MKVAETAEVLDDPLFRLDRIRSSSATGDLFLCPENLDVGSWLRDTWSHFQGKESREIDVRQEILMTKEIMPFDLGELDAIGLDDADPEAALDVFFERMLEAFNASDEGREVVASRAGKAIGWDALRMIEAAWYEYGATPASMNADELEEILAELFPRNMILDDPADAALIIPELRAFWQWARRAHDFGNAGEMLGVLDELEIEYPAIMNDPARYSAEKAFMLLGIDAGYDMHDLDQRKEFTELYEAALVREAAAAAAATARAAQKKSDAKAKQRRKMEKASRKRNRRK